MTPEHRSTTERRYTEPPGAVAVPRARASPALGAPLEPSSLPVPVHPLNLAAKFHLRGPPRVRIFRGACPSHLQIIHSPAILVTRALVLAINWTHVLAAVWLTVSQKALPRSHGFH